MPRMRSMSSDQLDQWDDDDSNRPHKKPKYSPTRPETSVIMDDADSSTKMSRSIITYPESNRWKVTRHLGKNSHSSVYVAECTIDGDEDDLPFEMMIESTELSQATRRMNRFMNEKKYLTCLKNPFVVSFYGHEITMEKNEKMYYNTILEYCSGRSLLEHIKRHKGRLPEDDVKRFASDILVGLKYIHGEKIIHCDIKPRNILLKFENKRFGSVDGYVAKISGFDKAITKGSVEYGEGLGHRRGTKEFLSPEVMMEKVLDYGADVWGFGCTVREMLTGERVWKEYGKLHWEGWRTLIGESDLVPYLPDYLSEKAKDFLTKCLEKDPAKRWSVDSLLKHEFLKWNDEEEEEVEEEEEDDENLCEDADVQAYEEDENLYEDADVQAYEEDEMGDADVQAYEEDENLYEDADVQAYEEDENLYEDDSNLVCSIQHIIIWRKPHTNLIGANRLDNVILSPQNV